MKKVLLSIVTVFTFGVLTAQEETNFGFTKGDLFIEGNLGFYSSNDKNFDVKESEFNFNPKVGYFISEKLAIGAELMYGSEVVKLGGTKVDDFNSFGAGIFGRYYILDLGQRFKTYAEAGLGFGSINDKIDDIKGNGFGFGAGLGIQYFVTEKIAINFALTDIVGFSSFKFKDAEAVNEFYGNVNVFNNFFSTAQFGLTFKL